MFIETQNFLLVFFLTVTELGHSKIEFPMSNIGCFNFCMWTVNIYMKVNFTGCTKSPTAYTRESNQYPCHLSNTPKKSFMRKELKAENWKPFSQKSSILYLTGLRYASDIHENKLYKDTTIFWCKILSILTRCKIFSIL